MPNSQPPPSNVVPISTQPVVRRRPGRPRVVRPQPDHDEAAYVARVAELAHQSIEGDPLVQAMDAPMTPIERLDIVIRSLARECAGLLYDRERVQAEGRDGVPQLCSRRIDGLLKLARLVVEREILKRASGQMDDETVLKLVAMLVAAVHEVIHDVAPNQADEFMRMLQARVDATEWTMTGE
jgi:hypothetical protein